MAENLFAKRFAIYEDIQQLLKLLINDADKSDFSDFAAAQHFVVMDEAIFFFSPATCAWLDSLKIVRTFLRRTRCAWTSTNTGRWNARRFKPNWSNILGPCRSASVRSLVFASLRDRRRSKAFRFRACLYAQAHGAARVPTKYICLETQ